MQFLLLLSALTSSIAMAHSINLVCSQSDKQVSCKGGFSDGSEASNLPWEVISYDDQLLYQGHTSNRSEFSFQAPGEDFYILMDAGPGHVVELDITDIEQN
ncbi:hypothetical protein H4O21_15185 [Oceanospirillum sp. D5]|uniref:Uncharacterized protein n=2 Tax=Oceanospirillum sediminis TaxID=2760088 RepID=A0A839ITZ0_9GAMM|nr:hypothetical protein [Oceanospirillum sediminis]